MRRQSDGSSWGVALEGRLGQAYNEEAFRYFLAAERKRSERSGHPFLLLLVELKEEPGASLRIHPVMGAKIFSRLWACLRETDCVGWYREERIAGAVLTPLGDTPQLDVCQAVVQRVTAALGETLPPSLTGRLLVHAHQIQSKLS